MSEHRQDYAAFISYARSDAAFAQWLHHKIETFRAPQTRNRVGRVFLDRAELSASTDLTNTLQRALESSRTLIVVCSRAAAKSPWVDREVAHFQQLHGGDKIIGVYVDGAPFSRASEDANIPPPWRVSADAPPLLVNATKGNRGDAALRVLAVLLGLPFDALRRRERMRQRRRVVTLAGAACVAAAIFAGSLGASTELTRRRQALDEFYRAPFAQSARSLVAASAPPGAFLPNSAAFNRALEDPGARFLLSVAADVSTTNPMSVIEYVSPDGGVLIAGDADSTGGSARLYSLPFDGRTPPRALPGTFAFATDDGFAVFAWRSRTECEGTLTTFSVDGRQLQEQTLRLPDDTPASQAAAARRLGLEFDEPLNCGRLRRFHERSGTYTFVSHDDRPVWALTLAERAMGAVSVAPLVDTVRRAMEATGATVRCHTIASAPTVLCLGFEARSDYTLGGVVAARAVDLVRGGVREVLLPSGAEEIDFSIALNSSDETYFLAPLAGDVEAFGLGANPYSTHGASEWELFAARTRRLAALPDAPCMRLTPQAALESCTAPDDLQTQNWFALGEGRFMTFAPGGRIFEGTREEILALIERRQFLQSPAAHAGAGEFVAEMEEDAVLLHRRWFIHGDVMFDLAAMQRGPREAISGFCRSFISGFQAQNVALRYSTSARVNEGCPCERLSLLGRTHAQSQRCLR